jgi:hypothetical protein
MSRTAIILPEMANDKVNISLTPQLFLPVQLFSAHLVQHKVPSTVQGIICTGACKSNLENNAMQ